MGVGTVTVGEIFFLGKKSIAVARTSAWRVAKF